MVLLFLLKCSWSSAHTLWGKL